jgi:hypothetical protein
MELLETATAKMPCIRINSINGTNRMTCVDRLNQARFLSSSALANTKNQPLQGHVEHSCDLCDLCESRSFCVVAVPTPPSLLLRKQKPMRRVLKAKKAESALQYVNSQMHTCLSAVWDAQDQSFRAE